MKSFKSFLLPEIKRFFCKRNAIIVGLLFGLSLIFVQVGIFQHVKTLEQKKIFQDCEKQKVSQFVNHRQYGTYGYRTIFLPAPMAVFFIDSGIVPNMTSYVDAGERLKIYLPLIGKNIFDIKKTGFMDFSGVILFFGTLMALFYGFDTFFSKEYLKFLSSLANPRTVFLSLVLSRTLILAVVFLVLFTGVILLTVINGFPVPLDRYFSVFFFMVLLLSIFFFIMGTAASTSQSKILGIVIMIITWFILLFIVPPAVDKFIALKANNIIPLYRLEMDKLKIVMDFERRSIKEAGPLEQGEKITDADKKLALSYINNELNQIRLKEEKMKKQMRENISLIQGLSMVFPTTCYLSAVNEISSRGYENLLEYYGFALGQKQEFVTYIFEKVYFSNFSNVVPFADGDKNIFHAASRLPRVLWWGLLINLLYIAALSWWSYIRFKKALSKLPVEKEEETGESTEFETEIEAALQSGQGYFNVYHVDGDVYASLVYNIIREIITAMKIKIFQYICHFNHFPPDLKVVDFLSLVRGLGRQNREHKKETGAGVNVTIENILQKKLRKLTKPERGELILELLRMKQQRIYLVYDAAVKMPADFAVQLKDRMEELAAKGAVVLYLTTDDILSTKSHDKGKHIYKSPAWCSVVEDFREHGKSK
ncbi:MAG: ABC transporter permease subunit [Candidatus Aminicenantes bacterium]|nr:ABC transporter permease subunit [Candidatus Aminicenantes bacterium]NIM83946.1 ABC transporter permease subunit [Candidatus Aminicenantes bacterium]NIN23415.1 ABC transporter permease subunit [Candidatus Aminicenantes bacterium]NIN47119.1 ABC transporter permease subunit [Candidatus Aminicenantes bacterium]NIN90043.1 ABC transporter permease subunit [Candidatus Aminicenantes bacterium]